MQIFINKVTGEIVAIDIDYNDTVINVYSKINGYRVKAGLCDQRLIYAGRTLRNDRALSDYNVKPGSTIFHSLVLRGGAITLMVNIVGQRARTITVHVEYTDTIKKLKSKIKEATDVDVGHQRLLFGTQQLKDTNQIEDYEFKSGSTIHLTVQLPGGSLYEVTGSI